MRLLYRRYIPISFPLLILCLVLPLCVVTNGLAQTPQTDSRPAGLPDTMTKAQASDVLALTQQALQALPAESPMDSPEGQRRSALQVRLTLLEEYLGLLAKAAALAGLAVDTALPALATSLQARGISRLVITDGSDD